MRYASKERLRGFPTSTLTLSTNAAGGVFADDPVRLLSAFVEEMDLTELYRTYERLRKNLSIAASDA